MNSDLPLVYSVGQRRKRKMIKRRSKRSRGVALKKLLDIILGPDARSETRALEYRREDSGAKLPNGMEDSRSRGMFYEHRFVGEDLANAGKGRAKMSLAGLNKPEMVNLDEEDEEGSGGGSSPGTGGEVVLRKSCRERKSVARWSPEVLTSWKTMRLDGQKDVETKPFVSETGLFGSRFCSGKEDSKASLTMKGDGDDQARAFKLMLAEEIKRQVVDELGDAGNTALQDLQVTEIEDIWSCSAAASNGISEAKGESKDPQQYVAKAKLMATVYIPLTYRTGQSSQKPLEPPKPQKPTRNEEQSKPQGKYEVQSEPQGKLEEQKVSHGKFDKLSHSLPLNDLKSNVDLLGMDNSEDYNFDADRKEDKIVESNVGLLDVDNFEIYNFDADRSEDKFVKGQIWALYDKKDGMPRHYAHINEVLSTSPFEVLISWLEPKTQSMEAVALLMSGNSLTCGKYDLDEKQKEPTTITHVDYFSHVVKSSEVGPTGEIQINPAKGDVWALYKGKGQSSSSSCGRYEFVQVVGKDRESFTVTVVPLIKVAGFLTRFIQQQKPFKISKKDFTRFSHQIPAYRLEAEEASGLTAAYLELDPASTPKLHE